MRSTDNGMEPSKSHGDSAFARRVRQGVGGCRRETLHVEGGVQDIFSSKSIGPGDTFRILANTTDSTSCMILQG